MAGIVDTAFLLCRFNLICYFPISCYIDLHSISLFNINALYINLQNDNENLKRDIYPHNYNYISDSDPDVVNELVMTIISFLSDMPFSSTLATYMYTPLSEMLLVLNENV